jgi:hypothetical protein
MKRTRIGDLQYEAGFPTAEPRYNRMPTPIPFCGAATFSNLDPGNSPTVDASLSKTSSRPNATSNFQSSRLGACVYPVGSPLRLADIVHQDACIRLGSVRHATVLLPPRRNCQRGRQVLGSTMHCVAGDGVGILAGAVALMAIGTSHSIAAQATQA